MLEYNFSHFAVSPCGGQTRENDKKEALRSSRVSGHWKSTLIKTHRHGERESSAAAAYELLSNTVITARADCGNRSVLTFRAHDFKHTHDKRIKEKAL